MATTEVDPETAMKALRLLDEMIQRQFQFEDGQLAGLVAAQIALRARLVGGTLPA